IYIASSDTLPGSGSYVDNNISFQNSGWGIQLWHDATNETLVNSTIFGNLTGGIVVGAGVGTDDNTVVNNNLVYNNPGTDGGIVEEGSTGTHNVYTDNLVFGNTPVNISLQNGLTATGTVSANPQFVNYTGDPSGNYHLQSSSPAINAGTSSNAPTTDYDGNTRPQGGAFDIGAYEYVGSTSGAVTLLPASLTFPNQTVGITSVAQFSTLTNTGTTTVTISGETITGDYALAGLGTCGTSLAALTSCTISVNFKPTTTGTRTGTVTVTDSATGSPQKVSLSGSGVSSGTSTPVASLSPTSLSFGNQTVGTASAAHVVTLKNTGTATLTISGITHTVGNFYFGAGATCISTLAAGASCTFSVVFKPATTGTLTGTVTVTDNATGSPQKVSLTGSGVSSGTPAPAVSLSPSSLSFGNQAVGTTSAVKYVTLTNTGNATLT